MYQTFLLAAGVGGPSRLWFLLPPPRKLDVLADFWIYGRRARASGMAFGRLVSSKFRLQADFMQVPLAPMACERPLFPLKDLILKL
jgi:hypothetical protein